ncbi:hypothetical protein N8I77_001665 [Diaporthe amygdali]|uniref:Uncharacterized protein n=2 Tax=Phomopsis amygdali TaxID=1214568 RepID=A0AAD9SSH4_PHOAM|nr:hypothetical protein N8I77_001665 [Diaporthe amygdali]KAK2614874.1 hypothetical protein N8I77_001665 [Diaporthe amygdali]
MCFLPTSAQPETPHLTTITLYSCQTANSQPHHIPLHTTFKMQYFTAIAALFASVALSSPVEVQDRQVYIPCSGLYGTAQCCATDVLGVADLDCADPPTVPTNASDFQAECADIGQRARCCVLPILEQGVLCNTPTGVTD